MRFRAGFTAAWQAHTTRLLQTLRDWPWFDTLRTLQLRFVEDRLGLTAGSLTFTTLIALVPLITVMLALFTAFPVFAAFQRALEIYFLQSLVPDSIARPVLQALTQFAAQANRLGTAGLFGLLVSALALMLTIDHTLNAIWRVRRRRPFAQRILVYWAALTLGPLLLGVSLSATTYAFSAGGDREQVLPGAVQWLLNAAEFALFAAALTALFRYVPNVHVRWAHALAGGAFCAVAFEGAKSLLAWYLTSVPTFSAVYGTFATLPILLLWIYLAWVIVLLGAVIAAYAPSLQMHIVLRPPAPGDRFELSLAVLRRLAQARSGPRHGLSALQVAQALQSDPLQVEPLLELLVELDWGARLDEEGGARHVLLADPARTAAAPLVDALLLRPDTATQAFRQRAGIAAMTLAELL
jgi:membrane protein